MILQEFGGIKLILRKKLSTRLICLIISGVLLTGALTVAAINGSPYEMLKNAIFNSFTYDSVRLDGEFTFMINGEVEDHSAISIIFNENGSLELDDNFFSLLYNDVRIFQSYRGSGVQWYSARIDFWGGDSAWPRMSAHDRNSAQGQFIELFIDIMVGDLKNNMYMTTNDGIRHISGQISHNQLPELVRLGIDMIIEQSGGWLGFGMRNDPITSFHFDIIRGDAKVDEVGNLLSLNTYAKATMTSVFGETHTFEFIIDINFSDIGTTVIDHPLTAVGTLLTREYIEERFGNSHATLYFTLNEDGTMNYASLTDNWPGNRTPARSIDPVGTERFDCEDYEACDEIHEILELVNVLVEAGLYDEALEIVRELLDAAWDFDEDIRIVCVQMWDQLIILMNDLNNWALMANF